MSARPWKPAEVALVIIGLASALFVCVGSAVALWGFSGFRGEACVHLGDLPGIVERTGRLTRCDQREGLTDDAAVSVFDVSGDKGGGRAFVTSLTDRHGNVSFPSVRFVFDGGEITMTPRGASSPLPPRGASSPSSPVQ
ncbi:MAG: hypothetical protein Q8L48_08530 [Archangium sp.]|nr:hypothetical protein [Archangium sp.]